MPVILTPRGRKLLRDASDPAASAVALCALTTCCPGGVIPPGICDDYTGCRQYCHRDRLGAYRSEACDCPCPGRMCNPPGYAVKFKPAIRIGERIRITGSGSDEFRGNPGAEWYCTVQAGTAPYATECDVVPPDDGGEGSTGLDALIEVEYDGNTYSALCPIDYAGFGGQATAVCTDGTIRATGNIEIQIVGKALDDPDATVATLGDHRGTVRTGSNTADGNPEAIDMGASCCFAGSGVVPTKVQDITAAGSWTIWDTSEDVPFEWEPKCLDCNGNPLGTPSDTPYSVCGNMLVSFTLEVESGVFELVEVPMEKVGAATWTATFVVEGYGPGNIAIAPTDINADPPQGCEDSTNCNDGGIDFDMDIVAPTSTGNKVHKARENGSCPPEDFWTPPITDSGVITDLAVSYDGSCA